MYLSAKWVLHPSSPVDDGNCHLSFHLVWLNFNQFLLSGICFRQVLGKQGLYICNTNEMCAVQTSMVMALQVK